MSYSQIEWTDLVDCVIDPGNILRSIDGTWWSSGAISTRTIADGDDGYAIFQTGELNPTKLCGLDYSFAGHNHNDVPYGVMFHTETKKIRVYESGSFKADMGSFADAGDLDQVVKVAVESGVVKYYLDDILKYTSLASPSYPLFVNATFGVLPGTICNAYLEDGIVRPLPKRVLSGPFSGPMRGAL